MDTIETGTQTSYQSGNFHDNAASMATDNTTIRFIHSSDWQLGMTRAFLSAEAGARFSQDRINAISTLGTLAIQHKAQFIVVAGDVFESNQLSRQTLLRSLDALKALPVPIFLLPGNHDPLDPASIFLTPEFQNAGDHIVLLHNMEPVPVPNAEGVEVVGAPWRTKHPSTDLCRDLANELEPVTHITRIAVAHGQVNTLSPDPTRPEVIRQAHAEQAIEAGQFHYLALGDRHSVTRVGDSGRIWYSGAPVATAFDEVDANKALLVEIEPGGACRVEPLVVGQWSFLAQERAMNGPGDLAEFEQWLDALPDKQCTAIKTGFVGSISLATAAALDALMGTRAELFASLRRRERTTDLVVVPDVLDQDSVSLSGYARDTWNQLLLQASQGDPVAEDALMLLYRLSARDSTWSDTH